MNNTIKISSGVTAEGDAVVEVDVMGEVTRRVARVTVMAQDAAFREALVKLGWTPPADYTPPRPGDGVSDNPYCNDHDCNEPGSRAMRWHNALQPMGAGSKGDGMTVLELIHALTKLVADHNCGGMEVQVLAVNHEAMESASGPVADCYISEGAVWIDNEKGDV